MKKSEYIEKCYDSNKAFFHHLYGSFIDDKDAKAFINDQDYLNGSLFGSISNIFMIIKEDLVVNTGNANYVSQLFISSLEESASYIGKIIGDKYYVDGYEFKSVAYGVSILRNKIAHGKYTIDFENEKVIFKIDDREVKVKIYDFSDFVVSAYSKYLKYRKGNQLTRDFVIYNDPKRYDRKGLVNTKGELKKVFCSFKHIIFKISRNDGVISLKDKECFEKFISKYQEQNGNIDLKKIQDELVIIGITFTYECEKMKSDDQEKLANHMLKVLPDLKALNYHEEIRYIGKEMLKYFDISYCKIDTINGNFDNLVIIDAIKKNGSIEPAAIADNMCVKKERLLINKYNFLGPIIAMFNSCFSSLYDTDLKERDGYHFDRSGLFDFSSLDLHLFQIEKLDVNTYPLDVAKRDCDADNALLKIYCDKEAKLLDCLNRVDKNNNIAILAISNNLTAVQGNIANQKIKVNISKTKYDAINSDYTLNQDFFKNKRIIEGLRNSISHGNYELNEEEDIAKTEIVFSDIYAGDLKFKCHIKLLDLYIFLEENYSKVIKYIESKEKTNLELV